MTPLSHLNAPVSVPYRHKVNAVERVTAVNLDLNGSAQPFLKASTSDKARQSGPSRNSYCANSAAPGFAAQVLVEAGLAGSDPFAAARCARAYDAQRSALTNLRLVA
jgi:hypothetical protein